MARNMDEPWCGESDTETEATDNTLMPYSDGEWEKRQRNNRMLRQGEGYYKGHAGYVEKVKHTPRFVGRVGDLLEKDLD